MANVTEYLELLQKLTKTNLDILKGINESFTTKEDHLTINVDQTKYVIPSFISLENQINNLLENFRNLVRAPETGEAFFNFDGNTRAIEVRKYTSVPNSLTLNDIKYYDIKENNIFKDLLTPIPYMKFNLLSLPDDINTVVIKKIIPKHPDLVNKFYTTLNDPFSEVKSSYQISYAELYKSLINYKKGIDYIEYETTNKLPIHKNIGSGTYVVEKVISDITDENLEQRITFKIRNDMKGHEYMNKLYYRLFDETIEKPLQIGDELTTYDGMAKMVITNLFPNINEIEVKLVNGEYLNMISCANIDNSHVIDESKLRFYSPVDFAYDKIVEIPLEEDRFIFVAVAALNDRMNIQSSWGTGLMVDTYHLNNELEGEFQYYYKKNVKNIGDILHELSTLMYDDISNFNETDFNRLTKIKPIVDRDNLLVTLINSHLNENNTLVEIRLLYSQKLHNMQQLQQVQAKIDEINEHLAQASFDDIIDTREMYTSQLTSLNQSKNSLLTAITKTINHIALIANDAEIPILKAKFRIRGYFDYKKFFNDYIKDIYGVTEDHIIGIKVQYRYKNHKRPQGESLSINDEFLFSDWIDMPSVTRSKYPIYNDKYEFPQLLDNSNLNEPSFNQIDIPITQGESVDLKLKVLYDYGYPFIQTTTEWSNIINIGFPSDLLKIVLIADIIKENNDDIETNRFNNILKDSGVLEHIEDKISDQNITYYHKSENIASGFYTPERRIIPLNDKLKELDTNINSILDEISGDTTAGLMATIEINDRKINLQPYQMNQISLESYDSFTKRLKASGYQADGGYSLNGNTVQVVMNIRLTNTLNRILKLYPLFPGDRSVDISRIKHTKFDKAEYAYNSVKGVWMAELASDNTINKQILKANQYLTFRIVNATSGQRYYFTDDYMEIFKKSDKLTSDFHIQLPDDVIGAAMYPYIVNENQLNIPGDSTYSFISLAKGESVSVPLIFEYNLSDKTILTISKTMAFDVRTSLYTEPISYNIKVTAKKTNSMLDNIAITTNQSNIVKYKSVVSQ